MDRSGYDAGFPLTMELQNVRRLGVFKLRNIGDVLMMTPVLRALRAMITPADGCDLADIAADVGSDVPLFLHCRPVRMRGRGERVEPIAAPLPELHGVIVKPDISVPTAAAYGLLDALPNRLRCTSSQRFLNFLVTRPSIDAIAAALYNDFEAAILPAFPEIASAHRCVTAAGCLRALLCGSGSAIFGLARDAAHAAELTYALTGRFDYATISRSIMNETVVAVH